MHLISSLISGFPAAASGTAEVYQRGTSTRATYYSSFEGDVHSTSGADLALDSNGSAEIYVNELVDVHVKDSSGDTVYQFVDGQASGNVEVQSSAFNGTHYETGATAEGNPTTLQAVLDLWETNNGAPDWKVLFGGADTTLKNALGPLTGLVYNVKDPTYGAQGDGATNDVTSIQAAIDAALAAGGGVVFFPDGNYYIEEDLVLKDGVSLLGAGAGVSVISTNHATENGLTLNATTSFWSFVSDLRITAAASNSGNAVKSAGTSKVVFSRCRFGSSNYSGNELIDLAGVGASTFFRDCYFGACGSTTDFVDASTSTGRTVFDGCRFDTAATYNDTNGLLYGLKIEVYNSLFNTASSTSGTFACYVSSSTTLDGRVIGCEFTDPGGATVTGIGLGTYTATSEFLEAANNLSDDSNFTAYSYTVTGVAGAQVYLHSREDRVYHVQDDTNGYVAPTDQYGHIVVERSTNADQAIASVSVPDGASGSLTVWNNSGGTVTNQTLSSKFVGQTTAVSSFTNGSKVLLRYRGVITASAYSDNVVYTQEKY